MTDWQVVQSTTDISIFLIIRDVLIWWALFCTVFKEYNDIALTSNVQTFCKYAYEKRCIWKLTVKNVVVYGVVLLTCNNCLSNRLNSANAIEELGFGLVWFGFVVFFFLLLCANCWVLFLFACLYLVCREQAEAVGKERKPQHWSCSKYVSSSPKSSQCKAYYYLMLCTLISL